ncbi:MAG: PTS sugar transporter subunit IIB [Tepidanaerobacteraceae bacterium]
MEKPKRINAICVCGCGMGSSLLLKMLLGGILDDYNVDYDIECGDSGTVPDNKNLIVTSTAFYEGLCQQFGDRIPVIAVKDFYGKEELTIKLKEIGYIS